MRAGEATLGFSLSLTGNTSRVASGQHLGFSSCAIRSCAVVCLPIAKGQTNPAWGQVPPSALYPRNCDDPRGLASYLILPRAAIFQTASTFPLRTPYSSSWRFTSLSVREGTMVSLSPTRRMCSALLTFKFPCSTDMP